MKTEIETTKKTTVTISVEDFLEKLNLKESGLLKSAFISQKLVEVDGFEQVKTIPALVILQFEEVITGEKA